MTKPNVREHRESPLRKECPEGAVEVILCCAPDLKDAVAADELLRWQAKALRELADYIDLIAMGGPQGGRS